MDDSDRATPSPSVSAQGAATGQEPALPPSDRLLDVPTQADPTVAAATAADWRAWLAQLLTAGRSRLAALGPALLLGFGAGLVTPFLFAVLANGVARGATERLDRKSVG